jgi:hypothetical protein
MASVTLEGNKLVVKCKDGYTVATGFSVDKANLGNLNKTVADAIDAAILKANDKHLDEVGALADRVSAEAQKIRGQLTAVAAPPAQKQAQPARAEPKRAAPAREAAAHPAAGKERVPPERAEKRITTPAAVIDTMQQTPQRSGMSMEWLNTKLKECETGGINAVAELYDNQEALNKYVNPETMKEHQKAATCSVFAALWKIPAFRLYLQAQAVNAPEFAALSAYAAENKGNISGADESAVTSAKIFMRHYLIDLMASGNAGYTKELDQLPRCSKAMEKMRAEPANLGSLKGPMESETILAAALHIRRKALEMQNKPENQIPVWLTPETMSAEKARQEQMLKTPLDIKNYEIRW